VGQVLMPRRWHHILGSKPLIILPPNLIVSGFSCRDAGGGMFDTPIGLAVAALAGSEYTGAQPGWRLCRRAKQSSLDGFETSSYLTRPGTGQQVDMTKSLERAVDGRAHRSSDWCLADAYTRMHRVHAGDILVISEADALSACYMAETEESDAADRDDENGY
jgi:hypothetical protein